MLKVPETEVGERVPVLKDFPHSQLMKRFVNEWKTFINKLPPLKVTELANDQNSIWHIISTRGTSLRKFEELVHAVQQKYFRIWAFLW